MRNPGVAIRTSVSLGMAVATELARRKQLALLMRFTADKHLHDAAILAALEQWADVTVENDLTDRQFQRLCDRIVEIASAS